MQARIISYEERKTTTTTTTKNNPVVIGGVELDHNKFANNTKDHFQNRVFPIDESDRQVWEMITNVPRVSKHMSYFCGLLNCVFPGWGTFIAACFASENVSKVQLMIALL